MANTTAEYAQMIFDHMTGTLDSILDVSHGNFVYLYIAPILKYCLIADFGWTNCRMYLTEKPRTYF